MSEAYTAHGFRAEIMRIIGLCGDDTDTKDALTALLEAKINAKATYCDCNAEIDLNPRCEVNVDIEFCADCAKEPWKQARSAVGEVVERIEQRKHILSCPGDDGYCDCLKQEVIAFAL